MTFLPIVERELRVAARRASTFWTRVVAAIVALLIAGGFLTIVALSRGNFPANQVGPILFGILQWVSFIFVAVAGVFLTSDCVSDEKREGTLGLLFLTDLRGYDVVLGKLLVTSLRAAYGLLAAFPVMSFVFLMGGLTGGQFWRVILVLLNTLFFSLAAGVLVSSVSRDAQRAMLATILVGTIFFGGLPLLDWALVGWDETKFVARFNLANPIHAFTETGASRSSTFWPSLALTHGIGWSFLALASWITPRAWHEKAATSATLARSRRWRLGSLAWQAAWRQRLLETNPIRWLSGRSASLAWILIAVLLASATVFLSLFFSLWDTSSRGMVIAQIGSFLNFLLGLLFFVWLASQASRFYVEARRNGMLELVLVTPVTTAQIIGGHAWALGRAFLLPALLLLGMHVVVGVLQVFSWWQTMSSGNPGGGTGMSEYFIYQIMGHLSGLVLFCTSTLAVAWFAMWMGLSSKKTNLAVIKTLVFVKVLPLFALAFLQGIVMVTLQFLFIGGRATGRGVPMWITQIIIGVVALIVDLTFILVARQHVFAHFRAFVAQVKERARPAPPPPLPPLVTAS